METLTKGLTYAPLTDAAPADRLARLPYILRIFMENVLRHEGPGDALDALLAWPDSTAEFAFRPARVLLQDYTGVPCVADLAAMRDAVVRLGGDAQKVNPRVPVDLVIDHSVIVDVFGTPQAFARNVVLEYERNAERYALLRWAQGAFDNFSVVPPGAGIVHQVNLEFLARVAVERDGVVYPDTLVGTDSHTTMIGGLGVLGWGVGGIEAEAAMIGEPVTMQVPTVVGVRLEGAMPEGVTATDLVLVVTQMLRKHGVVGKFVEFHGPGLASLTVSDRATISNMSPEYGATEGIFPVDARTLDYLRQTGRPDDLVELVETYYRAQGLFAEPDDPPSAYDEELTLDLASLRPSMAGPRRPEDRVTLDDLPDTFERELLAVRSMGPQEGRSLAVAEGKQKVTVHIDGGTEELADGSVVIAAITSCTNTSNPTVMVGAGLLARNAIAKGLRVKPTVKTSLAPGSPVVMDYLTTAGLVEPLAALGFHLVGFGCTTCIGNSGPLPDPIAKAVEEHDLAVASVLSGNRNFEGRIHPQVRFSFLASPPLVVAYALAGTVDIDLTTQPIGRTPDGDDVFMHDIWPSSQEIASTIASCTDPQDYRDRKESIFAGDDRWLSLPVPEGRIYEWDASSSYIRRPPFLDVEASPAPVTDVVGARCLALLGDSVTTDHISPAGSIPAASPAGDWLRAEGVDRARLHSYGARRGNHEVMVRGTFGNIRLRNVLADGKEGGHTVHLPSGEPMTIFQAAERYRGEDVPLVVIGGKDYGAGSSRDWAAKGTLLLGVRAVLAESFERIHRSNLVQMGVLPLEMPSSAAELGLTGRESFDIRGVTSFVPGSSATVVARSDDGTETSFEAKVRLDTQTDVRYFHEGGILPAVLREMLG